MGNVRSSSHGGRGSDRDPTPPAGGHAAPEPGTSDTPTTPASSPAPAGPATVPAFAERDTDGRPVALAADPAAVRVDLSSGPTSVALTVLPDPDREHIVVLCDLSHADESLLAPLAYLALQRARVWRRTVVATDEPALAQLLGMTPVTGGGRWAMQLDAAAHRLYEACDPAEQALVRGRFVDEAVATLVRRERAFADNEFCRAARNGSLRREQYVTALANTHQYVRYTPRLLARAIALAEDRGVREHFVRHFRGEQNHDRLVESDLRYLDADVEFVTGSMVPSTGTQAFMVVQESGIGFYGDFVRFLAAPFVAEGLSASLESEFLDRLEDCIRSWGYDDPAHATRFLRSHVEFDGGDEGHFALVAGLLTMLLTGDTTQQRFLNTVHLAADAFHRSYDDYAEQCSHE